MAIAAARVCSMPNATRLPTRYAGTARSPRSHASATRPAYIVELKDDCGYDDAPPCRKCQSLMRSVGVGKVAHSTKEGALKVYSLQPKPEWLRVEQACRPLAYALDDVVCAASGWRRP